MSRHGIVEASGVLEAEAAIYNAKWDHTGPCLDPRRLRAAATSYLAMTTDTVISVI